MWSTVIPAAGSSGNERKPDEGRIHMAIDRSDSLSGLTRDEAKEFHGIFVTSFILFTIIAIVAHTLVWMWRPWIPGPEGYASLEGVMNTAIQFIPLVA